MDARPQRIRVRGDENAHTSLPANKAVHQRNKSTSALNATTLGARNGNRRAFGDLSNVKASRDDSAVGEKPVHALESKPSLSQPAQRPLSTSGLKGLLKNVPSKPVNPAGKAPPVSKGTRRGNGVFRDHLQPVVESESSKEAIAINHGQRNERNGEKKNGEKMGGKEEFPVTADVNTGVAHRVADLIEGPPSLTTILDSDNTISDTDEIREASRPHLLTTHSIASEPEEYSEDDEGITHCELLSPTLPENTTGGTTTLVYPQQTAAIKRELLRAEKIMESTRTEEDVLEDTYDTSMVAEYNMDIIRYLRRREMEMLPSPGYMAIQVELRWTMRAVLVDWLVQVHLRFGLLPETLFACVNYIDRFLSRKVVSLGKLQLVGATALFIAAKYEEITAPSVQEIIYMVDGGYSIDEVLKAERFMLMILNYDLGWPGPMSFLRRISKADDYDLENRTLAKYFLETTIMDERLVATPPSYLAAAAHCLAVLMLGKTIWTSDHAHYSGYLYSQLVPVMKVIMEGCEDPVGHHAAIFDKYADKRFKRSSSVVEMSLRDGFFIPEPVVLYHPSRLAGLTHY